MCRIMEDFAKEERKERDIEVATKILEKGEMSEERIKELFNLTDNQRKSCCSCLINLIFLRAG